MTFIARAKSARSEKCCQRSIGDCSSGCAKTKQRATSSVNLSRRSNACVKSFFTHSNLAAAVAIRVTALWCES